MKTTVLCLGLMMLIGSGVYAQNRYSPFVTKPPLKEDEKNEIVKANFEKNGDFKVFNEERYCNVIAEMISIHVQYSENTSLLDAAFLAEIQQKKTSDFLINVLSEEKRSFLEAIPVPPPTGMDNYQNKWALDNYQNKWVERIQCLQGILNSKERTLQGLLSLAEERILSRKNYFRSWFCSQERPFFDENVEFDVKLQDCILENYISVPPEDEEQSKNQETANQDIAMAILEFMQNYDVSVLNERDCEKRPWYVVGCFFEFVCIENKSPKDESLKEQMAKFFPKTHNEFLDLQYLLNDSYTKQAEDAVRNWLISRFAYPEKELEGEDMKELLEILKGQLEAVQPWHRALNGKIQDEITAKFLKRFI